MRDEGVLPGIPDIFLAHARLGYHGLFIEMKRQKGGIVSESQSDMVSRLRRAGYAVKICHGLQEAKAALVWYMTDTVSAEDA
jgi:hypothetical protein